MRATVLCMTLAVAAACQPVDRKRQASNVADTTAPADTTPAVPPPPPPTAPGTPLDSVKLDSAGAVFLNDIAIATTGAIYITDTGIRFDDLGNVLHPGPDRIFRIGPDRKVTVAARGDSLGWPNGITVDPVGKRFIIVSFGAAKTVLAWKPGDRAPKVIAKGAGGFDGVAVVGTRILVSSWTDSTVSAYETGQEVKVITGVPSPADIGYDAKRNRVLIPILTGNRVEIWQLQ